MVGQIPPRSYSGDLRLIALGVYGRREASSFCSSNC